MVAPEATPPSHWRPAAALIITALNFVISVLNVNAAAAQVIFGGLILATVALYGRERRLRDRV